MRIKPGSCTIVVLAAFFAAVGSFPAAAEELSPRERLHRQRLADAVERCREAYICGTCQGRGMAPAATPEALVRRGEPPTRQVLCPTCLGTAVSGAGPLRSRMKKVANLLRATYPSLVDADTAREAERAVFGAEAVLYQDDVLEKLRAELTRRGVWTDGNRHEAVMAVARPIVLDVSVPTPRLKRDLDGDVRRMRLPGLFEPAREAVALPEAVAFDRFTLGAISEAMAAFRNAVVRHLVMSHVASPASQPAPDAPAPDSGATAE